MDALKPLWDKILDNSTRINKLEAKSQKPTLRDQFAMAALTGLVAGQMSRNEMVAIAEGTKGGKDFINCSFNLADKALQARQENTENE